MSALVSLALDSIGSFSFKAERRLRNRLNVFPQIAAASKSPLGNVLSPPLKMHTRKGDDQVTRSIHGSFWSYELPQMALYESALLHWREGSVIDVGANTGVYSLLSEATCDRDVLALEPLPDVADLLENNLRLNGSKRVTLKRIAASNKTGEADIFLPSKDLPFVETSASLDRSVHERSGGGLGKAVEITTDTLDRIVGQTRAAIVKIDVEGYETEVLSESLQVLCDHRPLVFCEILTHMHSDADIVAMLDRIGYLKAAIERSGAVRLHQGSDATKRQWDWLLYHREDEGLVKAICEAAGVPFVTNEHLQSFPA